jgi:RNA polymerase sigma-70 factor, ECF subfamily
MRIVRTATVSTSPTPPDGEASDVALVRRLAAGDPRAMEALYDRYGRPSYSLARRIIGEGVVAGEVVQEVFLALWRDPGKFDPSRGGFASCLLAATHHKSVDAVRREETLRRRRAQVAEEAEWFTAPAATAPAVEEEAWAGMRVARVRRAMRELPPQQRETLTLAYFAGYTQREIADLTDTPLGTVKTRMLAGMRRLRTLLDGAEEAVEARR